MFTSVIHPDTGAELQFKTGHDDCDTYRVGDAVDWRVIDREPGCVHLGDDAYAAEAYALAPGWGVCGRYFVIVKDHRVLAVVDAILDDDGSLRRGEEAQAAYWRRAHDIQPPPLDLWTEAAWAAKARRDEESRRRVLGWEAEDFHLAPEERRTAAVNRFTRDKMKEDGFFRRIMPETAAPEEHHGDGPTTHPQP